MLSNINQITSTTNGSFNPSLALFQQLRSILCTSFHVLKTNKNPGQINDVISCTFLRIIFIILLTSPFTLFATDYQSKEDFLLEVFAKTPPKPQVLWLKKDLQKKVATILDHKPGFLRIRYWQNTEQSVWIINEVGKTKPITVAVIVKDKKILLLKVLAFRESRGWEVKHKFFTDQFKKKTLKPDLSLSQPIDGISGATLSVRALTKIAQLALFFDSQIQHGKK